MVVPPSFTPTLLDRQWLVDRLQAADATFQCTILLIKVTGLADVEDLLGLSGRDRAIGDLAQRLRQNLGDLPLGHVMATEFYALLEEPASEIEVQERVARALAAASEPIDLGEDEIRVDIRIGVVSRPHHGLSGEALLSRAITALNAASRQRQSVVYFDADVCRQAHERARMHAELRQALKAGQLELFFQPKVTLPANRLFGFEALLRWRHPTRGVIPPAAFIPIAEETGLIREIDVWVAEQACDAIRRINDHFGTEYSVAINASASDLDTDDYIRHLRRLIAEKDIPPHWLEIEMTESTLAEDTTAAVAMVAECRRIGIKVSIDDFGMGHSSLHRLRHFPVSGLKLDRSFVHELGHSSVARLIIRASIELGHALGLQIVGEGVETLAQAEDLAVLGIDAYQGFLLSKPLPEGDLLRWIADWENGATPTVV